MSEQKATAAKAVRYIMRLCDVSLMVRWHRHGDTWKRIVRIHHNRAKHPGLVIYEQGCLRYRLDRYLEKVIYGYVGD